MKSNILEQLWLTEVAEWDIPGVTRAQAEQHIQACLICMDCHNHNTGIQLTVLDDKTTDTIQLNWIGGVDEHIRRGWRDLQEATEYGATAIAILLVIKRTKYTILERAMKDTGFDYWLIEEENFDEEDLFPEGSARLEVSGIIHAKNNSEIQRRVREKLKQTQVSDKKGLPAIIVVAEFSRPEARVAYKL